VWHNGSAARYVLYASFFHPQLMQGGELLPHASGWRRKQ